MLCSRLYVLLWFNELNSLMRKSSSLVIAREAKKSQVLAIMTDADRLYCIVTLWASFLVLLHTEKTTKSCLLDINTYSSDLREKVVVMVVLIRESKP